LTYNGTEDDVLPVSQTEFTHINSDDNKQLAAVPEPMSPKYRMKTPPASPQIGGNSDINI
jgi:hypothetical protein